MDIVLLLGFLAVLVLLGATFWLLRHILWQQGRLLLRLEAVAARLDAAGEASPGEQMGGSATGQAEVAIEQPMRTTIPLATDASHRLPEDRVMAFAEQARAECFSALFPSTSPSFRWFPLCCPSTMENATCVWRCRAC